MFLVVIDAHSKWIECLALSSCTSEITVESLRAMFATHGLPDCVVSDNGSCFTSAVFQDFLKQNGVKHYRSAPFKPASNGQAERAVQVIKNGLKKANDGSSLQTKLSRLLFTYRTRLHTHPQK